MEFFATVIAILTGVLTYLAWRNGRWMTQAHQDTLAHLVRMDEHLVRMDEVLIRIGQGQEEARKEMAAAIENVARLIVSESEKTRRASKRSRR